MHSEARENSELLREQEGRLRMHRQESERAASKITELQQALRATTNTHREFKDKVDAEMITHRAALEKYRDIACEGRARSRSPPGSKPARARH